MDRATSSALLPSRWCECSGVFMMTRGYVAIDSGRGRDSTARLPISLCISSIRACASLLCVPSISTRMKHYTRRCTYRGWGSGSQAQTQLPHGRHGAIVGLGRRRSRRGERRGRGRGRRELLIVLSQPADRLAGVLDLQRASAGAHGATHAHRAHHFLGRLGLPHELLCLVDEHVRRPT